MWEVEFSDEFGRWWDTLDEAERESLLASVILLRQFGPSLGRPHVDTLKGSHHSNMKELRTQHRGKPFRTLMAFDPRRVAILLLGGDKTGDKQFYKRMIRLADQIYNRHLSELNRKG